MSKQPRVSQRSYALAKAAIEENSPELLLILGDSLQEDGFTTTGREVTHCYDLQSFCRTGYRFGRSDIPVTINVRYCAVCQDIVDWYEKKQGIPQCHKPIDIT